MYNKAFDIAGDEADTEVQPLLGAPVVYKSDNELTELKDAYFQYERFDWFKIRWGQFKVPYSRHFLTSSGALQFVDRSETDKVFTPGRLKAIEGDIVASARAVISAVSERGQF